MTLRDGWFGMNFDSAGLDWRWAAEAASSPYR